MRSYRFIWTGKAKLSAIRDLTEIYTAKLKPLAKAEVIELKDRSDLVSEAAAIERSTTDGFTIVLDEHGKQMSSVELSQHLVKLTDRGIATFNFIVGSAYGLDDRIKAKADLVLALSTLTLTHDLVRIFLLEQIYRAEMIDRGTGYHH